MLMLSSIYTRAALETGLFFVPSHDTDPHKKRRILGVIFQLFQADKHQANRPGAFTGLCL